MINDKFEKTLDFIDLDPKFLISILKKYIIHIIALLSIITLLGLCSLLLIKTKNIKAGKNSN